MIHYISKSWASSMMKVTLTQCGFSWSEKFQQVLDSHAPAVAQRRCDKKPHRICPCSTPQLNSLNHQKLLANRQLLKTPGDPDLRQRFCTLRKECNKLSRRLNNKYFHDECRARAHQPKNLWQLINTLTGRVKAHCAPRADLEDLSKTFSVVVTDTSPSSKTYTSSC